MIRRTLVPVGIAVLASPLGALPASAQVMCSSLPNPIVVTGSADIEPLLKEFAVRLADESPPATIISVALGSQTKSCAGIKSVVDGTDFGGLPGRSYGRTGATITDTSCTFAAGQTADVAISEVFYETCADVPQPRPADIADLLGPVQPILFVRAKAATTQYLTHGEARVMFGCGVSAARPVADLYNDPAWVFCRDRLAGTQMIVAKGLGLPDATLPACRFFSNDAKMVFELIERDDPATPGVVDYTPPPKAIGFSGAGAFDRNRSQIAQIAFQAPGQSKAFFVDSNVAVNDRRNVRDGHYPLWGYVHFVAKLTGGSVNPRVADLVDTVNGTKTSSKIDPFQLELGAGLIPQCAMKVKRSADGGLLSPFVPAKACHCAFEAHSAQIIPPGCTPCASPNACTGGSTCQRGFCD